MREQKKSISISLQPVLEKARMVEKPRIKLLIGLNVLFLPLQEEKTGLGLSVTNTACETQYKSLKFLIMTLKRLRRK